MIPTSIDGTDITGATIDGQDVQEITVDGDVVFSAFPENVFEDFESGNVNDWTNRFSSLAITSNAINGNFSGIFSGVDDARLPSATYNPSFIRSPVNTMEVAAEFIEDAGNDVPGLGLVNNNNPDTGVMATFFSSFGGFARVHENVNGNRTVLVSGSNLGDKRGSVIRIELLYQFANNTVNVTWYENGTQFFQTTQNTSVSSVDVAAITAVRNFPRVDDFEVNFT